MNVLVTKRSFDFRFYRSLELGCLKMKDDCVWLYMKILLEFYKQKLCLHLVNEITYENLI